MGISPYQPNVDWADASSAFLNEFTGGFFRGAGGVPLRVNGYYYWIGSNLLLSDGAGGYRDPGYDGVWMHKTTDFSTFTAVGNILPTNPGGFRYVVRPHGGQCPSTGKYIIHAHGYNNPPGIADRCCVAESANIESWTWDSVIDPDGIGYKDCGLYHHTDDTAYAVYTNGVQDKIIVSQLATNWKTTLGLGLGTSYVVAQSGGGREAPTMIADEDGAAIALFHSNQHSYADADSTTYDEQVSFATTPLGTWSTGRSAFASDPHGTDYSAQISEVLRFTNGWMTVGDHIRNPLTASRQVWLPVDENVIRVASWATSRFTPPSNDLLTGLVAFFPLNEVSSTADAVERVGGLTGTHTGTLASNGVRLRSRTFSDGNRFDAANHATFQTGDIQVWWNVWIYFTALDANSRPVFTKDDQSTHREYGLYYDASVSRLKFYVSSTGSGITGTVTASALGAPSTATWYMVTCWHDSVTNALGIAINGTTDTTASYSGGITTTTQGLTIGDFGAHTGNVNWRGRIRDLGMWKAATPTAAQLTELYNGGLSLPYDYFTPAAPVNAAGRLVVSRAT